jgi:hypothetical protein
MLHMGMIKNQKHVWIFPLLQHSNTPVFQHSNTPVFLGNVSGMSGPPIDCDEEIT